jgi:Family of unknown function (DUF5681)
MREGAPASYRVSKQRSERKPAGRSLRTLGPLKMQYGCNATHAFEPGQSGNPAGKPKGARNKTTLAVEALLDGEAETLTRKAIELAKAGDLAALGCASTGLLRLGKTAPCSLSYRPFQAPRTQP